MRFRFWRKEESEPSEADPAIEEALRDIDNVAGHVEDPEDGMTEGFGSLEDVARHVLDHDGPGHFRGFTPCDQVYLYNC